MDERVQVNKLHENTLASIESRDDKQPTDVEEGQLTGYRTRAVELDQEIAELKDVLEREEQSATVSRMVRANLAGHAPGVVTENGETKYRTFAAYARDQLITRYPDIAEQAGGKPAVEAARERLMRAPQHTLSSDVEGLQAPQHLAQILDVIDASRPVIATANRVPLSKGKLTYPVIAQRPDVLLQGTEKTEGGTANMQVDLDDMTAQTFIGGGNLSWQTIEWSTPDALNLWFQLAGEAYAIRTEGTACAVLSAAAIAGGTAAAVITGGTADTFQDWIAAVVGGAGLVYDNSRRVPDTLYLSPDMFFVAAALTTDSGAPFITAGNLNISGLSGNIAGIRVVASAGFGTATAIVGDSRAFLVGETPGAPVQLRAVEPAIGGLEVGVIGAMAAKVYDTTRFATLL